MLLKVLINECFIKEIKDENVALLFSGGTDSLTCLFSLMEIGVKPTLYSFYLENVPNKDIATSIEVARYYKLDHRIIPIKQDVDELGEDVKNIIKEYRITRKTNIQCLYPFYKLINHIEENTVVTGLCADDLYGTSKSMSINFSKDKSKFDQKRKDIFSDPYSSAYKPIKELFSRNNKKLIVPYRDDSIIDYLMGFSWSELNKPKQKYISYKSYESYFLRQKIYRRNNNLQVISKVREWHNELLNSELNALGRKRVDEIYKDVGKELIQ